MSSEAAAIGSIVVTTTTASSTGDVKVVLEQVYRGSFERLLQYSGFLVVVVVMLLVMLLHVVFNVAKEWVQAQWSLRLFEDV